MGTPSKIIWMINNDTMKRLKAPYGCGKRINGFGSGFATKRNTIPLSALFLSLFLLFSGCEKDTERMDDYFVDFATTVVENAHYRFKLDNGRLLIPPEVISYSGKEGQRVVISYVPLEGDRIKINYVSNIFTGSVQREGYPSKYSDDPLKIQSAWVGGDYLNLVLETEYHSVAHSVGLLLDPSSTASVDLYFSHSTNNDPAGYPKMLYASFLLSELRSTPGGSPIPFRLFINTGTGMRLFQLELK